jgi:hypothetical protein
LPSVQKPTDAARPSLFRSALGLRLILAGSLSGLVWLAIAWALAA